MAAVVRRIRRENGREWADPCACTKPPLAGGEARVVGIRASGAELIAWYTTGCVTPKATLVVFQCQEGVLEPRLPDLFESVIIICATAHPIEVLWNNRMARVGQRVPIDGLVTIVTRSCSYSYSNKVSIRSVLIYVRYISNDHIRPWNLRRPSWVGSPFQRRHHARLRLPLNQLGDLNSLHYGADRDVSNQHTCIRRSA